MRIHLAINMVKHGRLFYRSMYRLEDDNLKNEYLCFFNGLNWLSIVAAYFEHSMVPLGSINSKNFFTWF